MGWYHAVSLHKPHSCLKVYFKKQQPRLPNISLSRTPLGPKVFEYERSHLFSFSFLLVIVLSAAVNYTISVPLQLFNIYLKRAAEAFGITHTREIYEKAIEVLPDEAARFNFIYHFKDSFVKSRRPECKDFTRESFLTLLPQPKLASQLARLVMREWLSEQCHSLISYIAMETVPTILSHFF